MHFYFVNPGGRYCLLLICPNNLEFGLKYQQTAPRTISVYFILYFKYCKQYFLPFCLL